MTEEDSLPADALAQLQGSTASADVRRIAAELLPAFYQQLRRIAHRTRARLGEGQTPVDPARVAATFPGRALDDPEVSDWLNELEQTAPVVVYLGDRDASAWTRKAIRQADMVVFACRGAAPAPGLTEVEAIACESNPASARRLVRIRSHRHWPPGWRCSAT